MKWLSELRSRGAAYRFNMGVTSGQETMPTIAAVFDCFSDEAFLEQAGFVVERLSSTNLFSRVDADSVEVQLERSLASRLGKLCMSLAQQRFLSLAQRMYGLPDMFLLFAHEEKGWVDLAAERMKAISLAWDAIQPLRTPFWKTLKKQSPMNMPLVKAFFVELQRNDFAPTDDLKEVAGRVARAFSTSAFTERGFQGCRSVEQEFPDRKLGGLEMWHKVAGDKMLSEANKFQEVQTSEASIDAPSKSMVPRTMWQLKFRDQSMDFRRILSKTRSPPYQTFTPESSAAMHEGMALMVELHK